MAKYPTLRGYYEAQNIEALLFTPKKLPSDAERCYSNNPNSLFNKYSLLVTWFANHLLGRDYLHIPHVKEKIGLLTPNGYHLLLDQDHAYFEFTTRAIYEPLLLPALQKLDRLQPYINDFSEAKQVLMWATGISKSYPPEIVRSLLFDTFNPDPSPETTSVDGYAANGDADFATCRGGSVATAAVDDSNAVLYSITTTLFGPYQIYRSFTLFDTSSIPDVATIISATYDLNINAVGGVGTNVYIVTTTPASNTAIVAEDYDQVGTVAQSASPLDCTSVGHTSRSLSATGIGNISKVGITKFGLRHDLDFNNVAPTGTDDNRATFDSADAPGTGGDPLLTVVYTSTSTSTSTSTTTTSTSTSTTTTSTSTTTTSTSTSTSTSTTTTSTSTSTSTSTTTTSTSTTTTSTSTTTTSTSTTTTSTSTSSSTSTSTSTTTTYPYPFIVDTEDTLDSITFSVNEERRQEH